MFIFSNLNLLFSSLTLWYFGARISPVMSMRSKNRVCLLQGVSRTTPKVPQASMVFAVGFPISCPFPIKRKNIFLCLVLSFFGKNESVASLLKCFKNLFRFLWAVFHEVYY